MAYNKLIDLNLLSNFLSKIKSLIPTKTSDLENNSGYIDGIVTLTYDESTLADFLTAYNNKKLVYCIDSREPAKARLAVLTYMNSTTSPDYVEFQYYKTISSHSDAQQGDQIHIYKLTASGWSETVRNTFSTINVGEGLSKTYSDNTIVLSAGMTILSYGSSTWNDFITAYNAKLIVYCRASSNSNPASGSQTRLAFMAYVNNADNPTNVEFQYYRSVSSHTSTQQGDQVFVYKLDKTSGWSVTTREASSKIVAGTNMTSSYSSGTLTLNADTPTKGTVGLENVDNIQQYSATNPPPYPVTSVNGSTGDVTINIPSNVSDLTNDSGYITEITSSDVTTALGYTPSNVNLLNNYRTITEQNEIDTAQDKYIEDLEQTMTETTIGPVALATFDASAADMPLKGLTVDIEPVQAGSGDPSPENVRPITGWTYANVAQTGKNLVDIDTFTLIKASSRTKGVLRPLYLPAGTYTLSFDVTENTATGDAHFTVRNKAGTGAVTITSIDIPAKSTGKFTAIVNATIPFRYFYIFIGSGDEDSATVTFSNIQLELGSVATDYESYQGEIHHITFPTSAGTVYGGTLDIPNKRLTVDRAFRTYAASEVTAQGTNTGRFNVPCPADSLDRGKWSFTPGKLPIADRVKADLSGDVNDYCFYKRYATTTYTIKLPVTALEEARTILDGLEICYYLASPIVYDLSNTPAILTLYGTNNIWADCGDVIVTYGAYLETLKVSLDSTSNELDMLRACIAPIEDGATASQAYAAGAYFFRNGSFCTALTAIDSGGQFTLGTNYQTTTVAAALIALQS